MNLQEYQQYEQDKAAWEQQRQRIKEAVVASLSQTLATDAQAAAPQAEPPVWEPSHKEIPLHELNTDNLDILNSDDDAKLFDDIIEAKRKHESETESALRDFQNYVKAIFRPGDTLCFAGINHKEDRRDHDFVTFEKAITREYFEHLQKANKDGSIYIATNTYPASLIGAHKGRTQENVVEVRALQADVDYNGSETMSAIRSSASVPQPSIVVESSPGKFQGIWLVDGISKEEAKPLMQAIAAEFKTDSAVAEVARVMRVPGFVNRKYDSAPVARTISQTNTHYTRADFKLTKEGTNGAAGANSKPVNASPDGPPIPYGSHDNELTRIAGVLRNAGFNPQKIEEHLIDVCEKRCVGYGSDYREMCRKIAGSIGKKPVGQVTDLVLNQQPDAAVPPKSWRDNFRAIGELEQGDVRMLIHGFLPEGTIFIGGLPGEGKTLFALSIARALTTGKSFLNSFFVPQTVPVIYLIPESGGRAFRKRCEKFQIPNDPDKFLCRTVSEGSTLPLHDASLTEAVQRLKPVVILDTVIRFSEAQDENAAAQNKRLVDDIIRLRQAGAIAVIGLHHATKTIRKDGMSLETVLRGTGDIAACADAVYGLLRDNVLYNAGTGPNEITVTCLKPRDFDPPEPFRIAATVRGDGFFGPESIIDQDHDFRVVSATAQASEIYTRIEQMIAEVPTVTLNEIVDRTGRSRWEIRKILEKLGYHRGRGGKKGGVGYWMKVEKADLSTVSVVN